MKAVEFLNIVLPEHDKTSCSDENTGNGFWSKNGRDENNLWYGRCRRCMALQLINKDQDVPKDVNFNELLS